MLTEKLSNIPIISKLALIFRITGAAIFAKNKDYVKKMISKTVDEFLPTLKERTPTIMDIPIAITARVH